MKYIVYITTNTVNDKIYVGVHKCENPTIFDGYIGCGITQNTKTFRNYPFHRAVKKYGYNKFRRHTLAVFDNQNDAYYLERTIVNQKFVQQKTNYNATVGGCYTTGTFGKKTSKRKPILQYTLSGKFVKEWDSISDAAEKFNCSTGTLRQALVPPFKSRSGYQWRYKTDDYPTFIGYYNTTKRVAQYDKNGELIKVWNSCKSAIISLGKKNDSALNVYAKEHKLYEGFQWRILRNNETVPEKIEVYKDPNIILQLTLDDKVVKEWNKQTLYKTNEFKNAKDCVIGRIKTYKGFKWIQKYKQ